MTTDPSHHVPPSERTNPHSDRTVTGRWRALARTPLRVIRAWVAPRPGGRPATPTSAGPGRAAAPPPAGRRWADPPASGSRSAGVFHAGEVEYAHLRSLPPFDTDHLVLTDLRIMRVRTDDSGTITQLAQAAPWQIRTARAEHFRNRATVTVEFHIGSSMRLEETTPAEAQRFIATIDEATARWRT